MALTDIQFKRYANVLLWGLKTARTGKYKKGDIVLVRYDPDAVKLAEILHARLLDMGMNPILRSGLTSEMELNFFARANNRQLVFQPPGERKLCENLNGSIYLHAPQFLTHLSGIDPKRMAKALVARKPLREILEKREEVGTFGWTLCMLPTPELAKQARLSMKRYTAQVIKACYLDADDPVREWKAIYKDAGAVKKWMNGMDVKYYRVLSKNVDLKVTPGVRRRWIGISGHNIPSFELFLSPDWKGTEGIYYANQPSFRIGNYVEGVRLKFKKGSAVNIEADVGEEFTIKQMSMDRGACRVGEFSLTDKRFSKIDKFMANTLYDENYGGRFGNCHIAVGASYSDTYDGNPAELTKKMKKKLGFNDSALHWDLVNTERKTVIAHLASGKEMVIYEDGVFKY
jgi:aminopeptidase